MATYKVVDADKLDTDLKAVADSIRAKGGTAENLNFPTDYVSAVENIKAVDNAKEEQEKTVEITENGITEVVADEGKTMSKVTVNTNVAFDGEIGKPYIDTSKMVNFISFVSNNPAMLDEIDNIDTSNGTNFSKMFYNCSTVETVHLEPTRKGTVFTQMFHGCRALKEVYGLDFSSMITNNNYMYMVKDCNALETISMTNTGYTGFQSNTFEDCKNLTNVTINNGWEVSIYLHYSNNLTVESLHGMIENLADLTGQTAQFFQIGATNLAKIDEEHITMLQNKNWNYS